MDLLTVLKDIEREFALVSEHEAEIIVGLLMVPEIESVIL